jgi:hypothetical protein
MQLHKFMRGSFDGFLEVLNIELVSIMQKGLLQTATETVL